MSLKTSLQEVSFYTNSIRLACDEINEKKQHKALKDVVGKAYENHRIRLWNFFGCKTSKKSHKLLNGIWGGDLCIELNNKIVALEEVKGHYLDSCFIERTLVNIAKTTKCFPCKCFPHFIIHSFTTYKLYDKKVSDICGILSPDIKDQLKKKLVYTSVCEKDRLHRNDWFQINKYAYIDNINYRYINKDIQMMKSIILQ